MKKSTKLIIEISLFVIIVVLSLVVYNSVNRDIEFEEEKLRKIELVKSKLSDARELQFAYEAKFGKYCNSWEELVRFATLDSLEFERKIGDMEDSAQVAAGLAYIEKVKIPVIEKLQLDSVFSEKFDINTLKFVPESDSLFVIETGQVFVGGSKLATFQISVSFDILLFGQDKQLIQNAKEAFKNKTKFEGIRVGKLDEASTEGNWE